jgi:putative sterol carrier protein
MPIPAFTAAWADAFGAAINADPAYAAAGKNWINPVALIVEMSDSLPNGAAVQLDLQAGVCVSAKALPPAEVSAPFVLSADLTSWIDVVSGATDPLMAVARGKLRLTSGSLGVLMLHAKAAKALVACAQNVDTEWPASAG